MDARKRSVFISYCWKDGSEYADELEINLRDLFEVFRDKSSLKCSDDMRDFMSSISEKDNIVMVVSEQYLYSFNCMSEMAYLLAQKDWYSKSTLLVVFNDIYKTEEQIRLVNYWYDEEKKAGREKAITRQYLDVLNEKINKIKDINYKLSDFIDMLANYKNPSQIGVIQEIMKKSKKSAAREAGEQIVKEGEEKLKTFLKDKKNNCKITDIPEQLNMPKAVIDRYINRLVKDGKVKIEGKGNNTTIIYDFGDEG